VISLYFHVPFCLHKCTYCDFPSNVVPPPFFERYIEALGQEIITTSTRFENVRVGSLFIGGGTPTLLPASLLCNLIKKTLVVFSFGQGAEITVEANPGTVDEEYFHQLLAVGVTRLSLGVQSFSERELNVLGRIHRASEAKEAFAAARRAGFANINLDLMYGLPGQSRNDWSTSLLQAMHLAPEHLSLYQLTVEEKTPLSLNVAEGRVVLPEEGEILAMDDITEDLYHTFGYEQYEISNYARPGYQCRHNCNYWQNGEYAACGAAAVSYLNGVREKREPDPFRYVSLIENGCSPLVESERLSLEESFRESVVLGLRMVGGLDRELLTHRFGLDVVTHYGNVLQRLIDQTLVELTNTHLRLTKLGRRFANLVMADLV
jgi:oxygen-independent coproporphyrinogen III oxidase